MTFVEISIVKELLPVSVLFSLLEETFIDVAGGVDEEAIAIFLAMLPLPFIDFSIGAAEDAFSMFLVELEVTLVDIFFWFVVVSEAMFETITIEFVLIPLSKIDLSGEVVDEMEVEIIGMVVMNAIDILLHLQILADLQL